MENYNETYIENKVRSMILQGIVDSVLDNSRLSYREDSLYLEDTEPIMLFIKTFFNDEYNNRLSGLLEEARKKEEKANEDLKEVVDHV